MLKKTSTFASENVEKLYSSEHFLQFWCRIIVRCCGEGQGSDVVYVIECRNRCLGAVQWTLLWCNAAFCCFFVDIRICHKWCVSSQGSDVVYVSECCNPCFGLYCRGHVPAQTLFFESSLLWWYCRQHVLAHVFICCGILSLHSVIASGCVNGCAYVSSRFLWVTCVSLLISSAYVSVSMMCVSSDRRCSRTVDPDDFFVHICGIKCRVMLRWVTCLSLLIASTHARYIRMSRCYVLFQKGLWRRKRYDWMFKRCLFYVQLILIDGNERWPAWGQRVTRVSHGTLRRTIWQKICCTRTWRWICVRMLKSNMVQKFSSVFRLHIFCGISSLHPFVALVRCIRYGKFARFTDYLVCLFWPQVLTPSRSSSRSWWINLCKYLFWLEIYCLLSLNYHLDLHRLSTHMVCLTRRKKGIEADGCCSRDCCWCCR